MAEISCSSAPFSAQGPGWMGLSWFLVGGGRKDVGPQVFLAASSLKHILFGVFFSCFPVNFECLKESLFLCRLPMHGGDLVLSVSFGLVPASQLAWRSLPSPSKKGKEEFGGEEIPSCLFCIFISALWQKEPGDSRRGFGVWAQSQGSQTGEKLPQGGDVQQKLWQAEKLFSWINGERKVC